jgi:hypothetical protein
MECFIRFYTMKTTYLTTWLTILWDSLILNRSYKLLLKNRTYQWRARNTMMILSLSLILIMLNTLKVHYKELSMTYRGRNNSSNLRTRLKSVTQSRITVTLKKTTERRRSTKSCLFTVIALRCSLTNSKSILKRLLLG